MWLEEQLLRGLVDVEFNWPKDRYLVPVSGDGNEWRWATSNPEVAG